MNNIENVLQERKNTHGDFENHAYLSQLLKDSIYELDSYIKLNEVQKEALEMIFHKIARILAGDPNFKDHWIDIAGYATLVVKHIEKGDEE